MPAKHEPQTTATGITRNCWPSRALTVPSVVKLVCASSSVTTPASGCRGRFPVHPAAVDAALCGANESLRSVSAVSE